MTREEHLAHIRRQHPQDSADEHATRLEHRLKHLKRRERHTKAARVGSYAHRALPWIIAIGIFFLVAKSLHGQTTNANINIDRVGGTKIGASSVPVNCISGCSGSGGGNAAASATGAAVPASASYTGFNLSGNLVGASAANPFPTNVLNFPATQPISSTQFPAALDGSGFYKVHEQGTASVSVTNFPATQAVTGTFFQATQPVSGTFFQTTQPVSIADGSEVTLGAKADAKSTATDTTAISIMSVLKEISALEQAPASTPVTGTFFQTTQPVSIATMPSTPVTGTFFQATQPVSGTVTANQGTANTAANAWTAKLTDGTNVDAVKAASTAAAAADPSAVVALSPNSPVPTGANTIGAVNQAGNWSDRILGNAGAALDAANNATPPANVVATGVETIAAGSQPTTATGGNMRRPLASVEGVQYVQLGSSNRFSCFVQAVTVTTQCQAAPGAGLRAYVTDVSFSNQAATVQTLDIVFGTGAACVTGTTALTHKFQMGTLATTSSPQSIVLDLNSPLVPTAANAICVRPSAATAFGVTLSGYIAP